MHKERAEVREKLLARRNRLRAELRGPQHHERDAIGEPVGYRRRKIVRKFAMFETNCCPACNADWPKLTAHVPIDVIRFDNAVPIAEGSCWNH